MKKLIQVEAKITFFLLTDDNKKDIIEDMKELKEDYESIIDITNVVTREVKFDRLGQQYFDFFVLNDESIKISDLTEDMEKCYNSSSPSIMKYEPMKAGFSGDTIDVCSRCGMDIYNKDFTKYHHK